MVEYSLFDAVGNSKRKIAEKLKNRRYQQFDAADLA